MFKSSKTYKTYMYANCILWYWEICENPFPFLFLLLLGYMIATKGINRPSE